MWKTLFILLLTIPFIGFGQSEEKIDYWDNGQIRLTGQYEKMCRIGAWKHYNHDGTLILEENYDQKEKDQSDQLVLLPL